MHRPSDAMCLPFWEPCINLVIAGVADDTSGSEATEESEKRSDVGPSVLDNLFDQSEPQVESRFGTEFWVSSIEETLLEEWESAQLPALHVLSPNKFIATDFTISQEVAPVDELSSDLPPSTVAGFPVMSGRLLPTPCLLKNETEGEPFDSMGTTSITLSSNFPGALPRRIWSFQFFQRFSCWRHP